MAVAAYANSRGADGSLLGAVVWFGLIAIVHWTIRLIWIPYASSTVAVVELVACGLAVTVALAVKPELDEMGGLLNYLIPTFAFGMVVAAYALTLARRLFFRQHASKTV